MINNYGSDYKVKDLNIFYGQEAYNIAENIFFRKVNEDPREWSNKWNDHEKDGCVLLIYKYMNRTNETIGIKLIIGRDNSENFSVVEEKHPYIKGLELVVEYVNFF